MDGGITKDGLFAVNNTVAPKPSSILSLFSLKGRTAVISGGPAGIGLAVAKTYAEAGANVAIWYNSNAVAHERAAEIEKEYGVSCEYTAKPRMCKQEC
jgi:sorbose reductase